MAVPNGQWTQSFCGCLANPMTCLCGTFCTPCQASSTVSKIDNSNCCVNFLCCSMCPWYSCWLGGAREKMRTRKHIDGGFLTDCCLSCFLFPCASCQLTREVEVAIQNDGAKPAVPMATMR